MLNTIITDLGWLDWLGLTIILVLLCVLAFLIWRRKHPKDNSKFIVLAEPLLASNRLLKIWRNFIHSIPWRLRSNALSVPLSLVCLLYTSPSPRDGLLSRMPSSA